MLIVLVFAHSSYLWINLWGLAGLITITSNRGLYGYYSTYLITGLSRVLIILFIVFTFFIRRGSFRATATMWLLILLLRIFLNLIWIAILRDHRIILLLFKIFIRFLLCLLLILPNNNGLLFQYGLNLLLNFSYRILIIPSLNDFTLYPALRKQIVRWGVVQLCVIHIMLAHLINIAKN